MVVLAAMVGDGINSCGSCGSCGGGGRCDGDDVCGFQWSLVSIVSHFNVLSCQ